jgi:hypothetical protein
VDTRPFLPYDDDEPTQIDRIPAPLQHKLSFCAPQAAFVREISSRSLSVPPPQKKPLYPPPLPIALKRKRPALLTQSDEVWLGSLPHAARAVLEAARHAPAEWPVAPRLPNAIVRPVASDGTMPLVSAELEMIDA